MDTSSARIKNAPFSTFFFYKEFSETSSGRGIVCRTIGQVFALGVRLAKVVDTAIRRIVLSLKGPSRVEVLAYPLILKIKLRTTVREGGEG